ncbi:MAG: SPOR domain-containing protein, partial [Azoarcus sp.]|jgi:DedD protein|nr:SPOR domain-containing protein [Azoarcus sp.]
LLGGEAAKPAAAASAGKGNVYVQIGAFGDAGRASALVDELKKQGFAAYAEPAGKVTRVRIGPLARAEGEKTVASLKAKGRKAVLVSR